MSLDRLSQAFVRDHPRKAARIITQLTVKHSLPVMTSLPRTTAAKLLDAMPTVYAAAVLEQIEAGVAAELIREINSDRAAILFRRLPETVQQRILTDLTQDEQNNLRKTLRYPEGVVGSVMDLAVPVIADDLTVHEAMKIVKEHPDIIQNRIFVVDNSQKLLGYVDLKDLVVAADDMKITSLVREVKFKLAARTDLETGIGYAGWEHEDILPVVDHSGVLTGMLSRATISALLAQEKGLHAETGAEDLFLDLVETLWGACAELLLSAQDKNKTGETIQ